LKNSSVAGPLNKVATTLLNQLTNLLPMKTYLQSPFSFTAIAVLLYMLPLHVVRAQVFTDIGAGLTGVSNCSVSWGDYDNDQDLDILLSGEMENGSFTARIYRNDGGAFTDINAGLAGHGTCSVEWGDADNDGDLDFIITGENEDQKTLLYKNNNGVFTGINCGFAYFGSYSDAAWGDGDNDGDADLVITGNWSTKYYRNDGEDTFTETGQSFVPLNSARVSWVDYDNDGDLDIFLTGDSGGGMVACFYTNEEGQFTQTPAGFPGLSAGSVDWGDYDSDGDMDLAILGNDDIVAAQSVIYRNDGSSGFTDIQAVLTDVTLGAARWGDFDNDGDLDLVITGKVDGCGTFVTTLYENTPGGVFQEVPTSLMYATRSSLDWGDYDGDGDLDLVLAGEGTGSFFTRVYRNDFSLPNFPPATPAGLQAQWTGESVVFSWEKASDYQTPQDGLTYNLCIGTSPQSCDIMSPMAHLAGGKRMVVRTGNTGLSNSYHVNGLQPGTYYWSVQTLDNVFEGSPFAPEEVFTLTPAGIGRSPADSGLPFRMRQEGSSLVIGFSDPGETPRSISVFQASGRLLLSLQSSNDPAVLDGSGFPSGILIIRVVTETGVYSRKTTFLR
jgi:hypothetical protein